MRVSMVRPGCSHRLTVVLLLAGVAVVAGAAARVQSAGATVTTLKKFTTPGVYTWTVPTGVTNATFDVFGARGGSVVSVNHGIVTVVSQGGAGGEAKGKFAVHAGQVFEIVVGGQGGTGTVGSTTPAAGGLNGGGYGLGTSPGGGGGGGSDVRLGGRGNITCAANMSCGFGGRIVVGGGGGGGSNLAGDNGQPGGGLVGQNAQTGGGQDAAVLCGPGTVDASFGSGTNGQGGGGGGGGGWFGGCTNTTAGGGSGFVSGFSLGGSFPGGTNQGDGKVIITTTT
jgi:hypothetical protein